IFCMPIPNYAPVAINVAIVGTLTSGEQLTGTFTYTDNEGDLPGTHLYQWYRSNNAAGANAIAIANATNTTYTLTPEDTNKYISFEITPVAQTGTSTGLPVRSAYEGPISAPDTIISFVTQNQSKNENANPNNINLTFSFPNVSATAVSVTITSNSYSRLTQSAPVTVVIPANQTSPYSTSVFNIFNNLINDGNSTLTFTITNVTGGAGNNSIGAQNTDTATIINDDLSVSFSENFQTFTGSGFDPAPSTGRLDSDKWRVQSDFGNTNWGGTHISGVFARGSSNGNIITDGVYRFNTNSINRLLGIQMSTGGYSTYITLRVQNTTTATLNQWDIGYTMFVLNNQVGGGNVSSLDMGVSYSINGTNFTNISGSALNTNSGTANVWTAFPKSYNNINASVAPNGFFYVRFEAANPNGFADLDEYGVDDVTIYGSNF
ncbi:MAG TPA: hypothetical protein VFM72_02625, partial [Aequorivita sp.]|nr:hypothetical protein [Aequorivita sp.]